MASELASGIPQPLKTPWFRLWGAESGAQGLNTLWPLRLHTNINILILVSLSGDNRFDKIAKENLLVTALDLWFFFKRKG